MKRSLFILLIHLFLLNSYGQKMVVITGMITDSITGQPLIGATIMTGDKTGTVTDASGRYIINVKAYNQLTLTCQYIGYKTRRRTVEIGISDTIHSNIRMAEMATVLDEIVVSASRYEQKLSDVMVSLEVIKPQRILNTNTTSLESLITQIPGVEILDGQPGIRGGSGYSYGTGSRVLVLVDDLPILSGDAGDVKWSYLPVENISQVEIIKGASSVLYGSSALNGVINIRTAYPGSVPATRISLHNGFYLDPKRKELIWWDRQPMFYGADFSHSRKIRNLDLVIGGNIFNDEGYRENDYLKRARLNMNINHRNQKISGLSYGVNLNGMLTGLSDFLIWQDADSGAYRQNPDAVSSLKGNRFNIDPYIIYSSSTGAKHSLKTRYFHIANIFDEETDKNNRSDLFFGEYKYDKSLGDRIHLTAGLSGTITDIYARLYGNHNSHNEAIFSQVDGNLVKGLKISMGLRFEVYRLDGMTEYSRPVFRTGLNYQAGEYSFLRASFGQGYRFPSVAEKYTATTVGSLNIFPNPELTSEKGWSTEIGFKQGIRISDWNGYIDLAAFRTEYDDMIEFNFGIYKPDSVEYPTFDHIGFKALNVGHARITGVECSVSGEGKIFSIPVSLMAGYTYVYPLDLSVMDTLQSSEEVYLKYRYKHSFKADVEVEYKRLTFGLTLITTSRLENIDDVFLDPLFGELILPGFPGYWKEKNKGYTILDGRFLCDISQHFQAGLMLKNILNKEYVGRPGDIQPPRNIALKLTVSF